MEETIILGLDRDGVMVENWLSTPGGNYFTISSDDIVLCKSTTEAFTYMSNHNIRVYILTNQAWIKNEEDIELCKKVNYALVEKIPMGDNIIEGFYVSNIISEHGERALAKAEKLRAIKEMWINHSCRFYMVGDSESDIAAGAIAGFSTIYIETIHGKPRESIDCDYYAKDILEAVKIAVNGFCIVKQKPIIPDREYKVSVSRGYTEIVTMAGPELVPPNDYIIEHDDGSFSRMKRESMKGYYNVGIK